jgi:PAS domain S-box-containing protein
MEHYLEKELQEELARSNFLFQFLDQNVMDGLWYWDLQAPAKEWMSPKFWQVLGYDPATKQHNPAEWQDIIHPEDLILATENLEKHLADKNYPYDQIVRYKHSNGHWVWIRCRGQVIRDQEDKPKRLLGVHTDVTEFMRTKKALQKSLVDLSHLSDVKMQLFSNMSHELLTPINAILGYTDLLLMSSNDSYSIERLEKVKDQTLSLTQLINDILLFSRLEAGQETYYDKEISVGDIVRSVVELKVLAQLPKGIEFLPMICIAPDARLKADLYRIVTVIDHLLDNAIKFSASGDVQFKLEFSPKQTWPVEPRSEKVWLRFSVIDEGIGIAPENIEVIFNPYNQVDNSDTRAYGGAGLGLSICRALVRLMKGEIGLESTLDVGSTFYFDIPVSWLDDEV